ncbi:MAG: uroporphyrinogen-III synthase [Specibacter sp.]
MAAKAPSSLPAPLAGLRVAVTRSADRASALADALAAAGALPVLVPLIDFESAPGAELGEALDRLAAGEYAWLVVSSITTVRAMKQWCDDASTTLAAFVPAGTRVATIGPTSVAVLEAEGIHVDLAPVDLQSAAGLVALWPGAPVGGNTRVLLPQSNIAEATITDGVAAQGWSPEAVTAYKTVDYPADAGKRLTATLAHAAKDLVRPEQQLNYPQLTPAEAARDAQGGLIGAVVLASPSAAKRVANTMAPLPDTCLVIAIGQPTRAAAEGLGLRVAATATHPTPEGIVAALAAARTTVKIAIQEIPK